MEAFNNNNNNPPQEIMDPTSSSSTMAAFAFQNPYNFNNNNLPSHSSDHLLTLLHCSFASSSNSTINLPPHSTPDLLTLDQDMIRQDDNNNAYEYGWNGNSSSLLLFGQQMDDNGEGGSNMNNLNMSGIMGGLYQMDHGGGEHVVMNTTNGMFEGKNKGPKSFVTERQRRENFNNKYTQLRHLIPNATKQDRASTVLDAITYINELKRTVGELKLLVEKKRISKERIKRIKTDDDDNSNNNNPSEQLRSSWVHRKCKDTEVDVRIVDDEVSVKLVQRKKINCLLSVSRMLDDLQLDLRHVAGGHVGDYCSYLFNSKICEGSTVYASAIANKLIEVVERPHDAASFADAPTTSF